MTGPAEYQYSCATVHDCNFGIDLIKPIKLENALWTKEFKAEINS